MKFFFKFTSWIKSFIGDIGKWCLCIIFLWEKNIFYACDLYSNKSGLLSVDYCDSGSLFFWIFKLTSDILLFFSFIVCVCQYCAACFFSLFNTTVHRFHIKSTNHRKLLLILIGSLIKFFFNCHFVLMGIFVFRIKAKKRKIVN